MTALEHGEIADLRRSGLCFGRNFSAPVHGSTDIIIADGPDQHWNAEFDQRLATGEQSFVRLLLSVSLVQVAQLVHGVHFVFPVSPHVESVCWCNDVIALRLGLDPTHKSVFDIRLETTL